MDSGVLVASPSSPLVGEGVGERSLPIAVGDGPDAVQLANSRLRFSVTAYTHLANIKSVTKILWSVAPHYDTLYVCTARRR